MFILKTVRRLISKFTLKIGKWSKKKLAPNAISRSTFSTSTFELNHLELRGKGKNSMKEIMKAKIV